MRNRTQRITKNTLIYPEQIELITGMDEEGAQREFDYIRRALGTGSKDLMIKQFCDFSGFNCKEVIGFLTPIEQAVQLFMPGYDINPL